MAPTGKIYCYIDESGDPGVESGSTEGKNFSVGTILTLSPIDKTLLDGALGALAADPDAKGNTYDQETLKRGYFHASLDSKNAHSHICDAIRTLSPLSFGMSTCNKPLVQADRKPSVLSSDAAFHSLMISLEGTTIADSAVEEVQLFIAERDTFPPGIEAKWEAEFWKGLLISAGQVPNIPAYFPKLVITVVKGGHPGIQVCDFLLWAAQRKFVLKNDDKWFGRVGLQETFSAVDVGGPMSHRHCFINKPVEVEHSTVDMKLIKAVPDSVKNDELSGLLCLAERAVHLFCANTQPPHVAHLLPEVQAVSMALKKFCIHTDDLVALASAYTKIADTLPIYDRTSAQELQTVHKTKKFLGIIYAGSDMRWFTISTWWIKVREQWLQQRPEDFGLKTGDLS